jgi:Peptidase family M28
MTGGMMNRRVSLISLSALALLFQPFDKAPEIDSIRKEEMRADLFFLAGDDLQGRLTNTPTNSLAGEFIKSRFERMGLKPAGSQGSFFQPYNLLSSTLGDENVLEVAGGDTATLRLKPGQDYYPLYFSASGRARGKVVFTGFGITAPELSYDDYRVETLRGSVVLALDHEPGERDPNSPFDGVVTAEAGGALRKTLFAQDKGAAGILFVRDIHNHPGPDNFEAAAKTYWPEQPFRIPRVTLADWVDRVRIPAVQISPALASILVRGAGRSLEMLSRAAESSSGIQPVPLPGHQVELLSTVNRHVIPDRNVIGLIEGSDAAVREESVIICAHYDHNGAEGDRIYNGADDDGSGTIALIEIAEAYSRAAQAGQRPRRSVLFAAWNSEERGLLGAWAYTENPLLPLDKTVAVLNMDMIGRNEEVPEGGGPRFRGLDLQTAESNKNAVNIIGTTRSKEMKSEVERANQGIGLDLRLRYDNNISNLMRRSDHWPFLQRGVPAIWFHTGLHPDYHTVYDRPEKINYTKMEKVARLVHQLSWNLAQAASRPRLNHPARNP